MGMDTNYGQMVQDMKVYGKMIRLMVKASLSMLMEIFMKVNG